MLFRDSIFNSFDGKSFGFGDRSFGGGYAASPGQFGINAPLQLADINKP